MKVAKEQDRLGWWPAAKLALSCVLFLSTVSEAWALNLSDEIQRQEQTAGDVARTLGRPTRVGASAAPRGEKQIQLQLIARPRTKRLVKAKYKRSSKSAAKVRRQRMQARHESWAR